MRENRNVCAKTANFCAKIAISCVKTATLCKKMAVCAFIIIAGLMLFQGDNMVPFAPMGASGIVRGSASAFFGYLGYDEVWYGTMVMV